MNEKISIIVRSRNEERWIGRCLQRIITQSLSNFEIVLVDNESSDRTIERARSVCPDIRIIHLTEFLPGLALNRGIESSDGELIVCLSAHCIPANNEWLASMLKNFNNPQVAGVYGRQMPTSFSNPLDKRDLLVTFGLDWREQKKDPFFHNANSMIRRQIWEAHHFNETVTNIEDRLWAKEVLDAGYTLIYEPEAPVYHYHGIHQNNDIERCASIVRILEEQGMQGTGPNENPINPEEVEAVALIPLRIIGTQGVDDYEPLILKTIMAVKSSAFIKRIIVASDNPGISELATKWDVEAPFIRPPELSKPDVRTDSIFSYALMQLENQKYFPDIVLPLEITYPFRPPGLFDSLIYRLLDSGLDTVLAGFPEYRPCWVEKINGFERMDNPKLNRDIRQPLHIGLPSLGCATYPEFIRSRTRYGHKVGIIEVDDPFARIEIRSRDQLPIFERIESFHKPASVSEKGTP